MMTFQDILNFCRSSFTEKEKGTKFEKIMCAWLKTDPRFNELQSVWMWEDFPSRKDFGGKDIGIDLVARTETGDYWAIQCKCYAETATIDKPAVDSFLSTSAKAFTDPETLQTVRFAHRVWISTTNLTPAIYPNSYAVTVTTMDWLSFSPHTNPSKPSLKHSNKSCSTRTVNTALSISSSVMKPTALPAQPRKAMKTATSQRYTKRTTFEETNAST